MTDMMSGVENAEDSKPATGLDGLDEQLVAQLLSSAKASGLKLTGEGGVLQQLTKRLLESALDSWERRRDVPPHLQRWVRDLLSRHAAEHAPVAYREHTASAPTLAELRSLYDSYRLDQVTHLIALMDPEDFREAVELRLEGRRIDFQARDRFQLAMSVVQDLEQRLTLPPFELWAEDYLAHTAEYRNYTARLHAGGELP